MNDMQNDMKKDVKQSVEKDVKQPNPTSEAVENASCADENSENTQEEVSIAEKLAEINDKYLRLVAEFDNFRKRMAREKLDILLTAGENVISGLLPVVDDFERAQEAMQPTNADNAVKEGVNLIYDKLIAYLQSQGLQRIEAKGLALDTDLHEAVGKMPVADGGLRGKIVEIIQNGYTLNGKVIRFAKVIVGD
ncbi:MAG: nucleotide exchange factor GrpE [Prevotellaceae bacterium]|jgi:molecular chaperone GrpE|nr:nucleotide exchange factor GrpE [Prevotellaceae bacterium]